MSLILIGTKKMKKENETKKSLLSQTHLDIKVIHKLLLDIPIPSLFLF
jgi:hypothetical protein